MEQRHALEGVMDTSMKNLKEIVDANTVIGDPVTTPCLLYTSGSGQIGNEKLND